MKVGRNISILVLSILLTTAAYSQTTTSSQMNFALQRGFRTGYSDGYMAGYRDSIDSMSRSYQRHAEYGKADRTYSKEYGTIEDFRDGYQQGFENGYDTGFERRSFDANLPTGLSRRGVIVGDRQNMADNSSSSTQQSSGTSDPVRIDQTSSSTSDTTADTTSYTTTSNAIIQIPRDTELLLELQDDLSTQRSRAGDKFTAKIVSPSELAGATVEGRVAKVTLPGRLKRRSELSLTFDRILLNDNRWSNFNATLVEVMPVKGDNIKIVDNEGTAIGQSSIKSDAVKVGAATGAGAIAGGVLGGPVGAAVGAGMGAAFGVGAMVIDRGKHINLGRNQQLRIKTAYETNIR